MINYYVAPTGSDAANGLSFGAAWLTPAHAQSVIRPLLATQADDITVNVIGTLSVTTTLELTSADDGQNGFKVIWKGGVLDAGNRITGWALWDAEKGIWRASYSGPNMRTLWVDGNRRQRSRSRSGLPGGTTLTATGYTTTGAYLDGTRNVGNIEFVYQVYSFSEGRGVVVSVAGNTITMLDPCHTILTDELSVTVTDVENVWEDFFGQAKAGTFYFDEANDFIYYCPRFWEDLDTAEVIVSNGLEKAISATGASNIDLQLTVRYTGWDIRPEGYASIAQGQYWNTLLLTPEEILLTPGYDRTAQLLYPPAAIYIEACENVNVVGSSSARALIERCDAMGLHVTLSSVDCRFEGLTIKDISANGMAIGQPSEGPLATCSTGIVAKNNAILRVGREFRGCVAFTAPFMSESELSHNFVKDVPYIGIANGFGLDFHPEWQTKISGNQIVNNRLDDVMNGNADGGAIYSQAAQDGLVISGNYITNSRQGFPLWTDDDTPSGTPVSAAGVYIDEGSNGVTIENNVMARVGFSLAFNLIVGTNTVGVNYADVDNVHTGGSLPSSYTAPSVSADPTIPGSAIVAAAGPETAFAYLLTRTPVAWPSLISGLSPLRWLRNDEAGVTSIDYGSSPGNGTKNGTYTAEQPQILPGIPYDSLSMGGGDITTASGGSTDRDFDQPFSFIATIKPTYLTGDFTVSDIAGNIDQSATNQPGWALSGFWTDDIAAPVFTFTISAELRGSGGGSISSPGNYVLGQSESAIAILTYDGGGRAAGMKLYVKGLLQVPPRAPADNASGSALSGQPLRMGSRLNAGPPFQPPWSGGLGEGIFFDYELSPEEVDVISFSALNEPPAPSGNGGMLHMGYRRQHGPRLLSGGSGEVTYDADAKAYFDKQADLGQVLRIREKGAFNAFVLAAKEGDFWDDLVNGTAGVLYPCRGGTEISCGVNAANPNDATIGACEFSGTGIFDFNGVTGTDTLQGDTGLAVNATTPNSLSFGFFGLTHEDGLGRPWYANLIAEADGLGIFPNLGGVAYFDNFNGARITASTLTSVGFFVSSRTADNVVKAYIDGVEVASGTAAQGTPTNDHFRFFNTDFKSHQNIGFSFSGAGLTGAKVVAMNAALVQYLNRLGILPPVLLHLGDSMTSGYGLAAGESYPSQLLTMRGQRAATINQGVPSQTLAQMIAAISTQVTPFIKAGWRVIAFAWGGSNDLFAGATAATVYANYVTYCEALRTAGVTDVVAMTIPDRSEPGTPGDFVAKQLEVNSNIVANYLDYADALLDVATILPDSTNLTDFQDGTHPTAVGDGKIATEADEVVDALLQ